MHITKRKHGGWFAHRDDGTLIGNITSAEGGFQPILVRENGDAYPLEVVPTREEAWAAIDEEFD